jgi:hypothetical protein
VFIAEAFTMVNMWKYPKCLLMSDKYNGIYTVEY